MEFRRASGLHSQRNCNLDLPHLERGEAPKFLETTYKFLCVKTDKNKEHKMKAVPGTLKMLWVLP